MPRQRQTLRTPVPQKTRQRLALGHVGVREGAVESVSGLLSAPFSLPFRNDFICVRRWVHQAAGAALASARIWAPLTGRTGARVTGWRAQTSRPPSN